jgi:hypothetical protein
LAGNELLRREDTLSKLSDSSLIARRRITKFEIAGGIVYVGTLIGVYNFRYKDNLQPSFHINVVKGDWRMGMDQTHHAIASYYLGRLGFDLLRKGGLNEKRATWIGSLSGFIFLTTQEILDGFDSKWYASTGDLAANFLGSALFTSQQLVWHNQRIILKWSYHPTSFPGYNPEQLGSNLVQKMIKDYNGQTFWLSANVKSFGHEDSRAPGWLNIAIGLGATGITGPVNNPPLFRSDPIPEFKSQRILFIAPDIDLSRIRTRCATLKWVFEVIGVLKFPLPALEISGQGVKFKPLYF